MSRLPQDPPAVNEKLPRFGNPERRAANAAERLLRNKPPRSPRKGPPKSEKRARLQVFNRLTWTREDWVSHQARIFRHRRNAEILLEKLLRDDRGYSPIVYVRLEELRVRGEWKTVRFAEGGEEE